ncbi:MAG: hypothetical protein JWR18_2261 [Segetibacter sp.]|jgi:hypothetical protein|nr:hypothetical protein [Segetibacter sp.]
MRADQSISSLIQNVKTESSKWIKLENCVLIRLPGRKDTALFPIQKVRYLM